MAGKMPYCFANCLMAPSSICKLPNNPDVTFTAAKPVSELSIPYPYVAVKKGIGIVVLPYFIKGPPSEIFAALCFLFNGLTKRVGAQEYMKHEKMRSGSFKRIELK